MQLLMAWSAQAQQLAAPVQSSSSGSLYSR